MSTMRIVFFGLTIVLLASCNSHINKKSGGGNGILSDKISSSALISWPLVRDQAMNDCMNCHTGKSAPMLNSANNILVNQMKVSVVLNGGTMPPPSAGYQALSECRKAIVRKWLSLGAPEQSAVAVGDLPECPKTNEPTPTPIPIEQMPVSYQTLLNRVLKPHCLKCHNIDDPSEASGILFFPFSELIKGERRWQAPGISSKVIESVTRTDGEVMPPPETNDKLNESEIQFIMKWIDAGKPEN